MKEQFDLFLDYRTIKDNFCKNYKYKHVSDEEIFKIIDLLKFDAFGLSSANKPWMDNLYGSAASALAWTLSTSHKNHPRNEGIWYGLDKENKNDR